MELIRRLKVEAGLKEMAALVEANEPGCLRYNFFWNEDLGVFQFFEVYVKINGKSNILSLEIDCNASGTKIKMLSTPTKRLSTWRRQSKKAWMANLQLHHPYTS